MVQRIVATERACLVTVELAAQTVLESHKHDVDQIGTVVKGQLVMVIAGEQRVLVAGDSYRVPAGTVHGARVLHEPTVVVDCFAPAREDLKKIFAEQNSPKVRAGSF
jgi:quercetin dioxygenase-like cupin family protein